MEVGNEKLMKIYWLRPAYQRPSFVPRLCSSIKTLTLTVTAVLLLFLIFLVICSGWTDHLGKHSGISYETALKYFRRTTPIEFLLDCNAWIQANNTCPKTYPIKHEPKISYPEQGSSENKTCPDYFRWIHEDLRHWKATGITREMVEGAGRHAHFRVVILDGKVYAEKFKESIQTRALFTLWGIVQLARLYPGRLPDLELMFDCNDRPVIPSKSYRGPNAGPPPLFRYCSDWQSLDIVFPDWSFWGWYYYFFFLTFITLFLITSSFKYVIHTSII